MVPKEWKLIDAKEVCHSISVGVVIKPSQYYVNKADGIKAFRSANVREGFINDSDWVYFSKQGHAANSKSILKQGDVLVVRSGYPGTACVVTSEYDGCNAIDIVIARPNKNQVDSNYLCEFTNSSLGKAQILNLQGGMAQKHLNVGAYQSLKLMLPPLPEQQKIAKILSTWDKAITTTEKLIATSQQQKKALMQQLLTGKKRLVNPETGKAFEGDWAKQPLKKVVSITYGKSPKEIFDNDGQYNVIGTGGVTGKTKETLCSEISVVIGRKGTIDKPQLVTSPFWAIDTTFYCLPINNAISIEWFYYLTNTLNLRSYNEASGVPSLSRENLYSIRIVVPSFKEQQKIASVLTAADKEIELLQAKLTHLKDEKKALMQQLLTGKRRVKVDTTEAA